MNPSLDYFINLENKFELGLVNRCDSERYVAGGKGVNVSIVLNNLMISSSAIGFLGGFTRDYYLSLLRAYRYILPNFTPIAGNTRINIKLNSNDLETDINAKGPMISDQEFNDFLARTERIYSGDTFVLSGHVQNDMHQRMLNLVADLSQRNIRIILDTNPTLMAECLKYHPCLIKPNCLELSELYCSITKSKCNLKSFEDIVKCAKVLLSYGAVNVLVSLGTDGALLVNEDGVYQSHHIEGRVVSTTGCGDSMIGAYVFNLQRGANPLEAFAYACAAGSATAFKEGLANREEIEAILPSVEIVKL